MVVIGYDGSEHARRAVAAAAELTTGRALIVHVWYPVPPGAGPAVASVGVPGGGLGEVDRADRELEAEATAVLHEGARHAADAGFDVEPVLVRGHHRVAWQELVDVVDQRGGTLLVVGRRGVSSLRSVLLGSVSEGAVKHARVPVLVVPAATATH